LINNNRNLGEWALLALRLVVGYGFLSHGLAKLSRGPERFAAILQNLHVPMPFAGAWLTLGTEILGGLALLLGIFVVWASIPMAFVLIVATLTVHLQYGFSSIRLLAVSPSGGATFGPVGFELNLLYFAALVVLALEGPGRFAIDHALHWQRRP
jgi:putative oxidoreductase